MPTPVEADGGKAPVYLKPVPGLVQFSGELACVPWVQVGTVPTPSLPVVFGSATYCAQDPATGYIWSMWRSGEGVTAPTSLPAQEDTFDGTYVLVYNPVAKTLIDSIRLGSSQSDAMWITYFGGYMYASVEGNSTVPGSDPYILSKINAATRNVDSVGATDYVGVISKLGNVSADASHLYVSITNGVGYGTYEISTVAPFEFVPGMVEANTSWLYAYAFHPFTGVRVYAGYGPFLDLRGPVTLTVDTSSYYTENANPQSHRICVKPCSPYVFTISLGDPSVLRVNTLTGSVTPVSTTFWPVALYYSPESGRLYVEGSEAQFDPPTVHVYDSDTLALVDTLPDYVIASGFPRGNSIYLGGECFAACESGVAPLSRLWFVGFPL